MKITKKIIAIILCLILVAFCSFSATAASTPRISLSNVTALPGESVTIDISISNNPGIMAMSFCITYDSDVFEYTGYSRGYLSRYTIKDHADKGQIAFVNDEASNKSNNGVMLSVKFLVKENAKSGKHTITIANQNRKKHGNKLHNSFSNSDLKYIVPSVTAGSITVGETCENAGHKYGDWTVITPADCVSTGIKEHTCIRCQYVESVEIPITHNFEEDWTVDKAATPTEDGIMSRHCKNCDAVTDRITFTYKEVEDSQNPDDNTSSDDSTSSDISSSEDNTSSDNTSSDVSSDENSSENDTSGEQSSQSSSPSDNTSSNTTSSNNNSSNNSSSNKTPINNTVGSKNPQSAVENTKDYQENIKPNLDNSASSDEENTNTESDTDINSNQSNLSAGDIVLFVVSGVISIAIIALAIILILKRKKQNKE